VYIEIEAAALATADTPAFMPTSFWVDSQGVQLYAKGQSVYTAGEELLRDYNRLNTHSDRVLYNRCRLTNDQSAAERRAVGATAAPYVLDLQPCADAVLSHAGPIGSYPANFWRVEVPLKAMAKCVDGSGDGTAATGGAISQMRLILVGHRETADNVAAVSQALATEGVKLAFSQPNYKRQTIANGSTSNIMTIPELQGQVDNIWILERASAGLVGTAPNTVKDTPKLNNLSSDTVSIGLTSNPTQLYGRALPQKLVRFGEQGDSYNGSSTYLQPSTAGAAPLMVDSGTMAIAIAEKSSTALQYGQFSGSLRLNNNFQLTWDAADPGADQQLSVIVFIRRICVLGINGLLAMVNEE
jgi:hypothetical protein